MGRIFFDHDDKDYAHTISDKMAMDSNGNLLMRVSDNTAIDMTTGKLHVISGWSKDNDD